MIQKLRDSLKDSLKERDLFRPFCKDPKPKPYEPWQNASIGMVDIGGVPHKTILASGNLIGPSRAGVLLPMPYGKALARWDTRDIASSVSHG